MRRFLVHTCIFLTVFLLFSCRPQGVLSTDKMTDLLFDIHLVQSMTDLSYGGPSSDWTQGLSQQDFTDLAYQSVLKKHDVTEDEFYRSIAYYSKKMRLMTLIYSDLGKRYDDYIQSIDTWTENRKTEMAVKTMLSKDDSRIRAQFERMHIRPDSTTHVAFSYVVDSARALNMRYIKRWCINPIAVNRSFTMVQPLSVGGVYDGAVDTTQLSGGAAAVAKNPELKDLLQRALPIDELLKLKAAGAYDALTPNQDQPVSNSNRTEQLRDRAANQR